MQPNLPTNTRLRAGYSLSFFGPTRGHNLFYFWGGLLLTLLVMGTARPAFSQTSSFTCTGAAQTYTVPAGITSLSVTMKGADGGMSQYTSVPPLSTVIGHPGGRGALINGRLQVTPGQVLNLYVGCTASAGGVGGFNGGGSVANAADRAGLVVSVSMFSNGGGGASDIRVGGSALTDRVVVAGGGGGSGAELISTASQATDDPGRVMGGGGWGGLTVVALAGSQGSGFQDVQPTPPDERISIRTGGGGGTDVAGGSAGAASVNNPYSATVTVTISNTTAGAAGSLGQGADATLSTAGTALAGGGGGGYYGGGSGASVTYSGRKTMTFGGGGGGGSSFIGPTFTSIGATGSDGINANGFITITPITSVSVTVTGNLSVCAGQTTSLTALASNGTAPYSYTWVAPAGITLTGGSTSAVTAMAGAGLSGIRTLTVTVQDASAPPSRTTVTVSLTVTNVSVSITPTPSSTVTPGSAVVLTASGATSYTWSDNSTLNPLNLASVASTTTLSVTGVTGLCFNTASVTVFAITSPDAPTLSASTSVVCEGTMVTVTGSTTSTVTGYQWYKDGVSLGTAQQTATLTLSGLPSQSGNYSLVVSNGVGSATSAAFSLTVNPQPTVTLVFNGATYSALGPGMPLITLTGPLDPNNLPAFQVFGGVYYERLGWTEQINGYQIKCFEFNSTGVFRIRQSGPYTITVTGANGCKRTVQGMIESR